MEILQFILTDNTSFVRKVARKIHDLEILFRNIAYFALCMF